MLAEIALIKQDIQDNLQQLATILKENNIVINTQLILTELESQLQPLKFFELKHRINNQTIFMVFSESNSYEILAEINKMSFVTYYVYNGKNEVKKYNSLLHITQAFLHPLAKQLQKQLQKHNQVLVDYDGDTVISYTEVNPNQQRDYIDESNIIKQENVTYIQEPINIPLEETSYYRPIPKINLPDDNSEPIADKKIIQREENSSFFSQPEIGPNINPVAEMNTLFALQKSSGKTSNTPLNPKFKNISADALNQDYTKD